MNIIIPEVKISVRYKNKVSTSQLFKIKNSNDIAELSRNLFNGDTILWTEELIAIFLNSQLKVIGYYKMASGSTNSCICDPKVLFTAALNCTASLIILCHNHPSGNENPSESDIKATKNIKSAGDILGIKLLDHLIITKEGFYSFADEGKI